MLDWVESQCLVVHVKDCCVVRNNNVPVPPPLNSVDSSSHVTMQSERLIDYCCSTGIIHLN